MKKLFVLPVLLGAVLTLMPSAGAYAATKTVGYTGATTSLYQVRTRYVTRLEQRGRRAYRVTYRVARYRNGRVVRTLVSRTRVR